MDMLQNIYSYPVPQCKKLKYYISRAFKAVHFPRQVADQSTRKLLIGTLSLSISGVSGHLFLSQKAQIQIKSVHCIDQKVGQGMRGFSSKDYCLWHS